MSGLSTEQLVKWVKWAQKGDSDAITGLIREHQERLFKFCVYLAGSPQLAQDLCQEAMIKAIQSLSKLKEPEKFSSWLLKIAKNSYLDYVKAAKNADYAPLTEAESETWLQGDSQGREIVVAIQQTLEKLDPEDRVLLLLVDMEGYSYQEAADAVGMNEKSVASKLHRIRDLFMRNYR